MRPEGRMEPMAETHPKSAPPPVEKTWRDAYSSSAEYVNRTVSDSKGFVLRSTPSLRGILSVPIRKSQELFPELRSRYRIYEDAFFHKVKDGLMTAREHPTVAAGVVLASGLLLMRGPRSFLFHQILGRFQSEEAKLVKAEKILVDLDQAVQLRRNETKKLLERAGYAENAMLGGETRLRDCAAQIQKLFKDLYKSELEVEDFMDELRELPGRDALKLRAEVASMMADMKKYRSQLEKRVTRISDLGIPV